MRFPWAVTENVWSLHWWICIYMLMHCVSCISKRRYKGHLHSLAIMLVLKGS